MGKIMNKLKHTYNAFPESRTKFFHKQCRVWSFPPSFNEFRHKFNTFKILGTINNLKIQRSKVNFYANTQTATLTYNVLSKEFKAQLIESS